MTGTWLPAFRGSLLIMSSRSVMCGERNGGHWSRGRGDDAVMGLVGADRHRCVCRGWLWGRRSRPQGPAGHGPWETSWAVYFSPHGGARNAILEAVRGAKQTILVQAYLLYSTRVAGALVRAHQRGVQVHVLLDAAAQPHHPPVAAVARLVAAGVPVSLDVRHAWAHDKVIILDGAIVITGSYNWTVAAERNNGENSLVIRDPQLARVYTENWRRHAHHSMPYRGRVPWRAYIRVAWVSLTGRHRKRVYSDMGEDR
jgi:phosphatidylserine/phosphatidylglycerophosphate/cardiolipin synthase-like enzyme